MLEPSMGDGAFVLPIVEKFLALYEGPIEERLDQILTRNVYGVEIDETLYQRCLVNIRARWGYAPARHNLVQDDFFRCHFLTRDEGGVADDVRERYYPVSTHQTRPAVFVAR